MRKIKVVVLLVRQLHHGFTKNAKVSPNLTVAHTELLIGDNHLNNHNDYYSCSVIAKLQTYENKE